MLQSLMPAVTMADTGGNMEMVTRLILGVRPANERRRYNVTPSLIGWVQT